MLHLYFWDRTIPVGFTWDDIVEGALDSAKCVVVLWSSAARNSKWVRIEATEGDDRGILASAFIERVTAPLKFRLIQGADLIGWSSNKTDSAGRKALISTITRCIGAKSPK